MAGILASFTPDTIRWLTDGNKHFTLKMKYCFDTSFSIQAEEHKINNYKVDYSKAYRMLGRIKCTSKPSGAKIYIDNVYTGVNDSIRIYTYVFQKFIMLSMTMSNIVKTA